MKVFTARSTGIGVATGVLVAAALGQLAGAAWGLAVMNGLAVGALALALSTVVRDGRFGMMDNSRRPGVWLLAWAVMSTPMFFVDNVIEIELKRADAAALHLLFGLTGFAAYSLGGIMATLNHFDSGRNATADPRLHRVTPPPGEPRAGSA